MVRSKGRASSRGVTLIEACIVMAIMTISVMTVVPGMRSYVDRQRLLGTASRLQADIGLARSAAMSRREGVRVGWQPTAWGSCYVVHTGAAHACRCSQSGPATCEGDAVALRHVPLPAEDRVAVRANVASIRFDPLHGTSTPTGTFELVQPGGASIRHVVNIMGRVRSCSPAVDAPAVWGYAACAGAAS
jgi:type IV fimbrial biogenesis protein FimT